MANPTSNFNWQMPTPTDLVTDLPADFEVFGQAVDTSLADLKGGTSGQVLAKNSNTDMDFVWVAQDDSNAIQNAIVDAKGDLIAASANDTPARLAVGNNGETLVADSSATTGLSYQANWAAGKNKIINGDFTINQRAFTSVTATAYTFDRFQAAITNGGGSVTVTPQVFTPGTAPVAGYEATNFIRIVTASQSGTDSRAALDQNIEDVRTFAGQTITVSFYAKAGSGTPNINGTAVQIFGSGGSASVFTVPTKKAITTSWARYSFTFAVPSISGKTIGAGSNLRIRIWMSAGSDNNSASDTLGIQNNTFDIWGVQVEASPVATAFQTATGTIQGELAACQRYYYRVQPAAASAPITTSMYWSSSTIGIGTTQFPVKMRIIPTALEQSGTASDYAANYSTTTAVCSAIPIYENGSADMVQTRFTIASGATAGSGGYARQNSSGNAYLGWSAEL